jgi:hypothetical protein
LGGGFPCRPLSTLCFTGWRSPPTRPAASQSRGRYRVWRCASLAHHARPPCASRMDRRRVRGPGLEDDGAETSPAGLAACAEHGRSAEDWRFVAAQPADRAAAQAATPRAGKAIRGAAAIAASHSNPDSQNRAGSPDTTAASRSPRASAPARSTERGHRPRRWLANGAARPQEPAARVRPGSARSATTPRRPRNSTPRAHSPAPSIAAQGLARRMAPARRRLGRPPVDS